MVYYIKHFLTLYSVCFAARSKALLSAAGRVREIGDAKHLESFGTALRPVFLMMRYI